MPYIAYLTKCAKSTDLVDYPVLAAFRERDNAWSGLKQAIRTTQANGATLLIVEIGRLSRNATFTGLLRDSSVEFICRDNPLINTKTIHVFAAMAEAKSRQISLRTREGLVEARARGVLLGSARPGHWEGRDRQTAKAQKIACKVRSQRARQVYLPLVPELQRQRNEGETLIGIAKWLNDRGHTTTQGLPFTPTAVWRVLKRYGKYATTG